MSDDKNEMRVSCVVYREMSFSDGNDSCLMEMRNILI